MLASSGLVTGYCYPNSGGGSFIINWPNSNMYGSSDCTGSFTAVDISGYGCSNNGLTDDEISSYANQAYVHVGGSSSSDDSLSAGAIAGIVIGAVVFVALVVGLIVYCVFYKKA